jgi:hypothetical protein
VQKIEEKGEIVFTHPDVLKVQILSLEQISKDYERFHLEDFGITELGFLLAQAFLLYGPIKTRLQGDAYLHFKIASNELLIEPGKDATLTLSLDERLPIFASVQTLTSGRKIRR